MAPTIYIVEIVYILTVHIIYTEHCVDDLEVVKITIRAIIKDVG